ncbi:MAG: YihY/virulence factor BrkB family protein [Sphingomonas sp.]|nr:MAG: YihY/virulence factor BrkB family protein [Sphingomonas sp.]
MTTVAPLHDDTTGMAHPRSRGRAAREFWEIPRQGWRDIAVRTWTETSEDNISLLAAGVAFYSFLAFVPMLASIVLVYGIVADPSDVAGHLQTLMRILPTDAAKIVAEQLKSLTETPVTRTTIGLIIAILLAIYGAMRGATSVIGALNVTYDERETRNFFRTTGLSLAFTVGAMLVAIVAMLAISAMSLIGTVIHLPAFAAPLVTGGLWLGTALVASGLIAVVYRYGPDREDAKWTWLTPGAVFASVGALLATFLFGLYVSHFAGYNATYGALGAVVSFLMWLYVTAFVVLLGAELNAEIERQTAQDTTTGPDTPMGERGATMADTTAGGPAPKDATDPTDAAPSFDRGTPFSLGKPLAAGFAASCISRHVGNVPLGVMPMTLIATGLTLVGQRGSAGRGLLCLAGGGLLTWRAHSRAVANTPNVKAAS